MTQKYTTVIRTWLSMHKTGLTYSVEVNLVDCAFIAGTVFYAVLLSLDVNANWQN